MNRRGYRTCEHFVSEHADAWVTVLELHHAAWREFGVKSWKVASFGGACCRLVRQGVLETRWRNPGKPCDGLGGRVREYRRVPEEDGQ